MPTLNAFDTVASTALYNDITQAGLYTLNERSVMRNLIRNYNMIGTPGLTASVPIYPTVAVSSPADGADLTNAAFDVTTSKTITASERGVMVTLTDLMKETATDNVAQAVGTQIGGALAEQFDTDVSALFAGFTTNVVGSGARELTVEDLFKAQALLRSNNVPSGDIYCVLHPKQAFQIKKSLSNTFGASGNVSDVANEAIRTGFVGRIANLVIIESNTVTGDSAGAFVGGAFHQDALGVMVKREFRIENQRDASLRADEIVGSWAYGVSELFDQYGVALIGDANL